MNSNPFGTPPAVSAAVANVPLDRYPDRDCLALRRILAERHGVDLAQVVVGNGTAELLMLIGTAFLHPGDTALILMPTFGEYERVARLMGAQIEIRWLDVQTNFTVNLDALAEQIAVIHPRVVFWCNPNNPTGTAVGLSAIATFAHQFPETLFVIDQAYFAFQFPPEHDLYFGRENVIQVRSMTKDYALAGLRLGYAVGAAQIVDALARVRPAWNVNALAQAAGAAALADDAYLRTTLTQIWAAKTVLIEGLESLGLTVCPSSTHYFLVHVGDAMAWRAALLHHGIMVRDCTSFGLPAYVRIATRTPDENRALLDAVGKEHG